MALRPPAAGETRLRDFNMKEEVCSGVLSEKPGNVILSSLPFGTTMFFVTSKAVIVSHMTSLHTPAVFFLVLAL